MGKMRFTLKKTMSFMLAIVLAVSLVPVMGEPIKVQAAGFLKNIYNTELGIGSINNPDAENGGGFCYVYYGSFDRDETDENPAEPVKYAVLCKDTTEYSNGNANLHTMLLDCANPLKYMQFDVEHKYSNVWKGSSVYNWMNDMDDEDSFIRKCLTDIERSAIISSYISEKDLVVGTGDGNVDQWTYDEYKHTAALTGEKVFALDVAEVSRKAYGFKPDRYYINARAKLSVDRKDLGSGYCYWWLRSPYISNDAYIGAVAGDGRILYSRNDGAGLCWASPSFNVDLSKIVLSTRISGKAGEKGAEYKLTLRDPELSISSHSGCTVFGKEWFDIDYHLEGDANQISVIVTDGDFYAEGTKIKKYLVLDIYEQDYYGILPKDGSGQTRLAYFSDFDVSKDRIYLLAERKNGEKETDYASEPFEIGISLKNEKTTSIGTGNINNPYPSGGWDYIYYGEYDPDGDGPKVPIALKHRVLSNDTTEYSANKSVHTMLVDCDNAIKKMNFDSTSLVSNVWADSDAYNWLNISLSGFGNKCFAYWELRGLINNYKGKSAGSDNVTELKGERFFILDVDEATRQSFGYQNNAQRAKNRLTDGASSAWYLRSPDSENTEKVKLVANSGNIVSFAVNAQSYYISPAFNIDLSEILYSTLVSGKAGTPGAEYKLTMYSPDYNISLTEGKKTSIDYNVISVPIHVKDNYTSSARFAVMVTDGDFYEKGTKIKYFGYPAVVSDKTYNEHDDWVDGLYWDGYCSFTIPEAYDPVTDKMYIIYERIRGGRQSDFAGKPLEVQLNDPSAIKITKQPRNATVGVNNVAYFEVEAEGEGLKYLWQYKLSGKSLWTDWTTKTTAKISVAYADYRDGMRLRCVITDKYNNQVTSNEAILRYTGLGPVITEQPKNATVKAGELAYFSVKAKGNNLKYLWQYKLSGETGWTNWTSKTTADISVAYAAYRNKMSLRCVISDADGNKITSNEAVLTYTLNVGIGPVISQQPQNAVVGTGELAYFSVKASGKGLKYLWQYKLSGETNWVDWTTKTTAKISVAYATYRNGMSLRCVITDGAGNTVTSNEAVLIYSDGTGPVIIEQPKSTTAVTGSLAFFSVKATGNNLKYLWQYKLKGETVWVDWTTKTTAEISVAYASYRNGMSLRCVITDKDGNKVTSSEAVLKYVG